MHVIKEKQNLVRDTVDKEGSGRLLKVRMRPQMGIHEILARTGKLAESGI